MTRTNMEVAATIRYMRERKGLSAAETSRLIGYSQSYINKVERGEIEPSLSAFAAIVDVLGFSDTEVAFTVRLANRNKP